MCLILDTNKYGDFLNRKNQDMEPVRTWLRKKGKIAYSPTRKFEKELTSDMKSELHTYRESGKMKFFEPEDVQNVQDKLSGLESDDPHIIALAKVAEVRLLVSGDQDLHKDFKKIVKGRVYQNKSHKKLLKNDLCP